jgi:hypothetical protein
VDHADQQCSQRCPADAAQTTGHHHHKGLYNHVHVHLQGGRLTRQLQRTTQASQGAAQRHNAHHQRARVDAQGVQHVTVLGCRTHALADCRVLQKQEQSEPNEGPQRNHYQLIDGKILASKFQRTLQPRKARCEHFVWAKTPAHGVGHEERQAKGRHQLV